MRFVSRSGGAEEETVDRGKSHLTWGGRSARGSGRARKRAPFGIIIRHPLKYPVYDDRRGNFAWTVSGRASRAEHQKPWSLKGRTRTALGATSFSGFSHRGSLLIIRGRRSWEFLAWNAKSRRSSLVESQLRISSHLSFFSLFVSGFLFFSVHSKRWYSIVEDVNRIVVNQGWFLLRRTLKESLKVNTVVRAIREAQSFASTQRDKSNVKQLLLLLTWIERENYVWLATSYGQSTCGQLFEFLSRENTRLESSQIKMVM